MRSEFRKVIADGDLILQQRQGWWLFGDNYLPYRNESEEVRLLKEHMDRAFMHYKEMQRLFVVAQKNVRTDIELLQMHKMDNSEVAYLVPCEQSILEERDGIKYSSGGSSGNNKQSNGNGNNQQKSNDNQQNQNKQKQQQGRRSRKLLDLLLNAEVTVH